MLSTTPQCPCYLFIYLGFYVTFNTVQVISQRVVGRGRGNQYIQFIRVLYCKQLTNGKQLPAFPLEDLLGTEPRPQRWEARAIVAPHSAPVHHRLTIRRSIREQFYVTQHHYLQRKQTNVEKYLYLKTLVDCKPPPGHVSENFGFFFVSRT